MNEADQTLWRHHFGLWIEKSFFLCEVINFVFTLWQIKSFKKIIKNRCLHLSTCNLGCKASTRLSFIGLSFIATRFICHEKKSKSLNCLNLANFWSPLFKSSNFKALYLPNYMSNDFQIWHGDRASQYLHILISRQLSAMPSSWCNFRLKTPMSKFSFCVF